MPLLYLAGPIDDVSIKQAQDWRKQVADSLPAYTCFDPSRAFVNAHISEFPRLIKINKEALGCSDVIIAYLDGPGKAIGTIREIEQATRLEIRVIVVVSIYNERAGLCDVEVVETLDSAISLLRSLVGQLSV